MKLVKQQRCAIYTRSACLQGENRQRSMIEQRNQAIKFIYQHKKIGLTQIKNSYDDASQSGAQLDRPLLNQLKEDIVNQKIDIVLIHSLDRISRSLKDFKELITFFDKHNVTLISIKDDFNSKKSATHLLINTLFATRSHLTKNTDTSYYANTY